MYHHLLSVLAFIISSLASFIAYLIAALISSKRNKVIIWIYTSYLVFLFLVYSIINHYVDGAHYSPQLQILTWILCFVALTIIIPAVLHIREYKQWFMWLFTFILPIFVGLCSMLIVIDLRPMSENALESLFKTEMPNYKVVEYCEFSPGGDDWRRNCTIQLYDCDILDAFYKVIEEKCINGEGTYESYDCYTKWSIAGGNYQFFDKANIENWMTVTIDKENNKIYYQTVKI